MKTKSGSYVACFLVPILLLGGCASGEYADTLPETALVGYEYNYVIGPGDNLGVFVWRNPELSQNITVRPDGKISAPLVEDLVATGKTPTQLARELETVLETYVRDPLVTVIVGGFRGTNDTSIRIIGEATGPRAIPYSADMTLLDLMIQVGGITEFAAGNRTKLVRYVDGEQRVLLVRLEDLIKDGDITANIRMAPGDILIVPEAWF